MSKNEIPFYWICDKIDCKSVNYRKLAPESLLIEDQCDLCNAYIYEPLTLKYKRKLKLENGKKEV